MMLVNLYGGAVEVEFRESNHRYKVNGQYSIGVSTVLGVLNKELTDWAAWMAAENFKEAVTQYVTSELKITKKELKLLADTAKKAHRVKSQRGKDVGTITHAWIAEETAFKQPVVMPDYVKNLMDEIALREDSPTDELDLKMITDNYEAAKHCIAQWRQWKQDYDVEIIKSEFIVHSKKLDYCGTCDVVFRSKRTGKVYLADYKTSEPQKIRNSKYMIVGYKPYPEHFVQDAAYDYAHHEEYGTDPDGYAVIYLPKEGKYQMFSRENIKEDRENWEHLFKTYQWIDKIRKEK